MGQEAASTSMSACAHGGIYSVDHTKVKLDFSSSVNPLGTPPRALREITRRAKELSPRYPDPECTELKEYLGQYLKVDPSWLVVGNGAIEIIYWFAQAFAKKRTIIPSPTFCEYELASRRAGSSVGLVPMHQFALDPDAIIKQARGAGALYLCNPNNPTGLLATSEIEEILDSTDKDTAVLLDECFIELVDDPARNSLVKRIGEFGNLVILRSLTKSFGLAGLRVGYACCSPLIAEKLEQYRIPWNVNGLAQAAGVAALSDASHLKRARVLISRERKFLQEKLRRVESLIPLNSHANFFMLNIGNQDSTGFRDALLAKTGVLVRDCSTFAGMDSHHLRIAVRNREDNSRLLEALEAVAGG
jgi:threonine-phosphate decarboxylase